MELKVELLDDFMYSASGKSFEVKVILSSDKKLLVDKKVNVNLLELCSLDVEYFSFGINRTILSKTTESTELSPEKTYVRIVDLFHEDNLDEEDEVLPGRYQIEAAITVFVYGEENAIKAEVVKLNEEVFVEVVE